MVILGVLLGCSDPKNEQAPEFDPVRVEDGIAYIPAEQVYQAMTAERSFYILDARPTNDYELDHIEGAYSVPFYEVQDHFFGYPIGAWYIAYCGCPHSESGEVASYFLSHGHSNVGILEEGYIIWKEEGYPIEEGS